MTSQLRAGPGSRRDSLKLKAGANRPAGTGQRAAAGEGHRGDTGDCEARRLSRNAVFLLALRDSGFGVRFVVMDMPEANGLTVGIMVLVAQAEREAISRRTKGALAVVTARGVELGKPNDAESLWRAGQGGAALKATVSANAKGFAADLAPVLEDIRADGHTSLRAIAAELTAQIPLSNPS